MERNVFVYGALMFPTVFEGVTGTLPVLNEARLIGFRRYAIKDSQSSAHPAIIPDAGGVVDGKLVRNVTDDVLAVLDRFEEVSDGLYHRCSVTVESPTGPIEAEAYVAGEELRKKLSGEWDPAEFERLRLTDYLTRVVAEFRVEERAKLEN